MEDAGNGDIIHHKQGKSLYLEKMKGTKGITDAQIIKNEFTEVVWFTQGCLPKERLTRAKHSAKYWYLIRNSSKEYFGSGMYER